MVESLSSPIAHGLTLTLLHFFWQGTLIGFLYWMLATALNAKSVQTRYALSLVTLTAMALCPLITCVVLCESEPTPEVTAAQHNDVSVLPSDALMTKHDHRESAPITDASVSDSTSERRDSGVAAGPTASLRTVIATSQPYLLLLWLAGVILSGARLAAGLLNVIWLRSGRFDVAEDLRTRSIEIARQLGFKSVRLHASDRIAVAAVVGFFRQAVLLPASWLTELPTSVLEAVIAHELAHIRRFDVWVNLFQRLMETIFFYHPMVWWVSNRMRFERELCCDELAVEATGDRGKYVMALEQVGRLEVQAALSLTPAISGDGKMKLLHRVQHILGIGRPQTEPSWLVGVLTMASLTVCVAGVGVFSYSDRAMAQESEARRSAEAEAGPRRSAEAEPGPRRSAEGDASPRRSVERDAPRRSAERDASAKRSTEGARGSGERLEESGDVLPALREFKPETQREAELSRMIIQLQREVAALRQAVRGRGTGERGRRDGGPFEGNNRRDGDARGSSFGEYKLPPNWQRTKEGRIFLAYDKNRDEVVSLEEWLAMTDGNNNAARRVVSTKHFNDAEPSGDGKFTPAEFIWWRQIGSKQATEQIRQSRTRDGELGGRGPRDGEGERSGPGDGESGRSGPRDGESRRSGPRDGEGERSGPRDGESRAKGGPRDGE